MGFLLKEVLKTLCGSNQWCYAVFWKIGSQNPNLLILEECHYESTSCSIPQSGLPFGEWEESWTSPNVQYAQSRVLAGNGVQKLINKMMMDNQVNVVGEGIVGRSAFLGKHQWILLNNSIRHARPPEVSGEVYNQILAGMQTTAVIPVLPHGVLQFGSPLAIPENIGFINDVKSLILQLGCVPGALLFDHYPSTVSTREIGTAVTFGMPASANSSEIHDVINSKYEEARVQPSSGDDLFDMLGLEYKSKILNDNALDAGPQNMFEDASVFTNRHNAGSEVYSANKEISDGGLFSGMGTDHLLDAVVSRAQSFFMQSSDDNVSCRTTATKTRNHSQTSSVYGSEISSWAEQDHNAKRDASVSTAFSKKPDDSCKPNRKRIKLGENPRPRPKDRQMIQDRVKELRELVPNGAKCSIDALLERTIKHMLFLQNVTKHADKLKKTGESKIVSKEGVLLLKDNFDGGATWAFEVGSGSMVCPIIVEDLGSPRQMLVEMLCEDRGVFLEIADFIRGMGLTILRGVMETRNDKIWAQFAVEADRDVTRMEVFVSLVRLLEQTAKESESSVNSIDENDMFVRHHAASILATGNCGMRARECGFSP